VKLSECSVGRVVLIQEDGRPTEVGHVVGFSRLYQTAPLESTKVEVMIPSGKTIVTSVGDLEVYCG